MIVVSFGPHSLSSLRPSPLYCAIQTWKAPLKNHGLIEDGKNRKVVRLVIVKNTRSTVALQDRIRRRTRDAYEDKKKKKKTSTSASYVAEDETKQNKIQPVPV